MRPDRKEISIKCKQMTLIFKIERCHTTENVVGLTFISGCCPRGTGTGLLHRGQTGT